MPDSLTTRPGSFRHILVNATIAVLLSCSTGLAGDPPDAEIAKLVRYLGSPEYRDRQSAHAKLLEIGTKALPELRSGAKHPDAEVARLCEGLVTQIRAAEREAIINGKKDMPGQAGKRFKQLAGDSKASRTLFADMIDDDRRALVAEQAAAGPANAAVLYRAEIAWAEETWKKRFADFDGQPLNAETRMKLRQASRETVPPGEVTLVFFLGSYALPAGEKDAADVESVLKSTFIDLANLGDFKAPFRKLFVAWLDNRRDAKAVRAGLQGALFGVIPEAVPIARRFASDPKSDAALAGTTALVLGNLGSLEDLPTLAAMRNDARTYETFVGTKTGTETIKVQVRDQAVTMSLQLRRARSETYGFAATGPSVWWTALYARPFQTMHLQPDKNREAAHAKAWSWLDRQAKVQGK